MSLTFTMLRAANVARLPQFRNKHGDLAHSMSDGSDWSPAQWLQAVLGELGEYANVRKKYERGDLNAAEFHAAASKELADVQTYLDILAFQLRIDLGAATAAKFNEVSRRVGCDVKLPESDTPEEAERFARGLLGAYVRLSSDLMSARLVAELSENLAQRVLAGARP